MDATANETTRSGARAKTRPENAPLWTKNFVFGTLVNFLLMLNYYSLMVVITDFSMKTYGAPAAMAGLAASIFIIGALVARVLSGFVMDRIGRKRVLVAGIAVEAAASALYLLDIGFAPLFALRLVHGFAYGGCSTTIGTVVTSLVPPSRRGEGVGYYMLSTTLGAAIGPFLGMFLSQNVSYQALFATSAAVAVIGLFAIISLKVPEAKRTAKFATSRAGKAADGCPSNADETDAAADDAAAVSSNAESASTTGAAGKAAPSKTDAPAKAGIGGLFRKFFEPSTLSVGIMCGVLWFCYSSLLTFLTPFAEENGLQTASSFFFVAYAAATFVTRPFTGKMFDRKGDRIVMVPAFIAFAAGMALLSSVHHPVAMFAAAALLGYGAGTVQSSALALAVRMAPPERLSLANSTFYVLLDTGVGIGPLILGIVEPFWGYRGLFLSMAALSLVSFAIYLIIGRNGGKMRKLLELHS